jgi:hypothetical protein
LSPSDDTSHWGWHATSHPLRFGMGYMECGDLSPLSKALTSQRIPEKKEGDRAWP